MYLVLGLYCFYVLDFNGRQQPREVCRWHVPGDTCRGAAHADTRVAELGHIAALAAHNNLRLNKTKTREVVFYDNRRRHRIQPPPPLPDIIVKKT